MRNKKSFWVILSILTLLTLAIFSAGFWLPGVIERKLEDQIIKLKEKGFDIHYDSLNIALWKNEVIIGGLVIDIPAKKLNAKISSIRLQTFKVFPFLFQQEIHFKKLIVDQSDVTILKIKQKDSTRTKDVAKPLSVFIDSLRFTNIAFHQVDSTTTDTLDVTLNLRLSGLSFNNELSEPVSFSVLRIDNVRALFPFYAISINHLSINKILKQIEADSLTLKPLFKKREFARRMGVESDRFSGVVSSLRIDEVDVGLGDSTFFTAKRVKAIINLYVFRNKHYPFPAREYMALPMDAMKKIPIPFSIDTLRISNSYISYEEVGEKADSSGTIFFKDLQATLLNITRDSKKPAPILTASAKLMGEGKLSLQCEFSKTKKPSYLKGTLTAFPLTSLNDVLKPQAKLMIESGVMSRLAFNFSFTNIRSDGTVDINYNDLKVTSLRENKKEKVVKNELLTLALNAFIKNDVGKTATGEKKTGTILFYRDPKKAIFNYWWKSLFSGIKSAFNVSSAADEKSKKKKE